MAINPIKIKVEDLDDDQNTTGKKEKTNKKPTKKSVKKIDSKKKTTNKKVDLKKEQKKVSKKKTTIKKPIAKKVTGRSDTDQIEDRKSAVADVIAEIQNKNSSDDIKDEKVITNEKQEDIDIKDTIDGNSDENVSEDKESNKPDFIGFLSEKKGKVKDVIKTTIKEEEEKQLDEIIIKKEHTKRSISLYRRIAVFFIVIVALVLGLIFWVSYRKVEIALIPTQERVSNNMIFDIYDIDKSEQRSSNSTKGIVREVEISSSGEYNASGEEILGKEAVGKVAIVNNYSKSQPLVATTRLLSPGGLLFRLDSTVNVPAGGSVEVGIYADDPSEESAIGPSTFTIPGLWAGLQDKIYAKSNEAIVYQQKVKKHITQEDIDNGIKDLKSKLLVKAKEEVNNTYSQYKIIYKIDENSIETEIDSEAGEEKDSFNINISAKVIVVAFEESVTRKLARDQFISSLPSDKEMISFDENKMNYALNSFDLENGTATLNATFEGKITLKESNGIFDKEKILGLNDGQLKAFLDNQPDIAGFEVKYYPSFMKSVPKYIELGRIKIEVKNE